MGINLSANGFVPTLDIFFSFFENFSIFILLIKNYWFNLIQLFFQVMVPSKCSTISIKFYRRHKIPLIHLHRHFCSLPHLHHQLLGIKRIGPIHAWRAQFSWLWAFPSNLPEIHLVFYFILNNFNLNIQKRTRNSPWIGWMHFCGWGNPKNGFGIFASLHCPISNFLWIFILRRCVGLNFEEFHLLFSRQGNYF